MRSGLAFKLGDMKVAKFEDIIKQTGMFKMHFDAAITSMVSYIQKKNLSQEALDNLVTEIILENDKVKILVRDKEDNEALSIYRDTITFPYVGNLNSKDLSKI
jgi:hypothetical protein